MLMISKRHTRKILWSVSLLLLFMTNTLFSADFVVNPKRYDPYKQYKFRVRWDGKTIPGILTVDGLHLEFEVQTNSDGKRKSPGKLIYRPITIARTRTHDTEFESWVQKVQLFVQNRTDTQTDFRKDVIIELLNEAGQLAMSFKVYRCWPSNYAAIDSLDANNTTVAIESIVLEYEGWERDTSVTEPKEPSLNMN